MRHNEEARWSLETSHRAPTKGETILANHVWLCSAVIVAIVFALPHILGHIYEAVLYV
jgi:hypothetical protein